jgi:hypothetical protein
MMNRINRDRTLHPHDGFIATRILQYTGLQENLEEIKKVAELATRTADKIEEQHTQEINNGLDQRIISRAMNPTWEKAWDHRHNRMKSYYNYENWIWRIQKSLQTALSKRYYSPASEQAELESRRVRRKIQNDPWGTNV